MNSQTDFFLSDYVELERWFAKVQQSDLKDFENPAFDLLSAICSALSKDSKQRLCLLANGLIRWLHQSVNPQAEVSQVEATLAEHGLALDTFLSECCEFAILSQNHQHLSEIMIQLADETQLLMFRFFSAWIALNSNQLALCVDECDKIETPHASIATLQGQALLELGRTDEAIESLQVATALDPSEILAHFQLAKAFYVQEAYDKAWQAMQKCQELDPGNIEIATFFSFIALQSADQRYLGEAWEKLFAQLAQYADHELVITLLTDIAFQQNDVRKFRKLLNQANWKSLGLQHEFSKKLPWILKQLNELGWHEPATQLLDEMIALTKSNAAY